MAVSFSRSIAAVRNKGQKPTQECQQQKQHRFFSEKEEMPGVYLECIIKHWRKGTYVIFTLNFPSDKHHAPLPLI
ncbi:MAG: hypothetical protein IJB46_08180 [Prevotella sp.]|nr:hypothetical protein [Prevotella sp.]